MPDPNLTAALTGSLDLLRENSPLNDLTPSNAVDEFLDTINDDLKNGAVERITPERLDRLVTLFRADALHWEQAQKDKPVRRSKKPEVETLKLDIQL